MYDPPMLLLLACTENNLAAKEGAAEGGDSGGAGPDIAVSPAEVDFGEVAWGFDATATVTITNVGDGTLELEDLALAGSSAELDWTALTSPILPAGGTEATVLTWTPTSGEDLVETLEIRSDDPDEPLVEVPLEGTVPAGEIEVEPASYDFGTLAVGTSSSVVVTVSNVGDGPLTVTDWTYEATDADMVLTDAGALTTIPATLAPGDSTEVLVTYAPSDGTGDEGSLGIVSDDADEPLTVATQYGTGEEDDPCDGFTQTVELMLTADDAWEAWIDGTSFTGPNASTWSASDSFTWELACGDHALSIYATDTAQVISGVIAVVWVEGAVRYVSGPTDWTMLDTEPDAGWTDPSYDDSSWHIPEVCADDSIWGSSPQAFYDAGAQWIWWTSTCTDLGEAWLRLNFTVP
jgi:hypothetical protein